MNFILVLLITGFSFGRSIVPERIVTPNLNLFQAKNLPDGNVEVPMMTYSKKGEFIRNGSSKVLTKETFEKYLSPSKAVFEMIPDQTSDSENKYRRGTAFSIGNNLVLTNNHVLDESFMNTTECKDFQIKNSDGETFECKKVHYCNPAHDICLIEMKTKIKNKRDCLFCPVKKVEVSLAQGPSLKLKEHFLSSRPDQEITSAIGNPAGYGIHFSQGRGVKIEDDRIYFYAPITKGNSGGALLSDDGVVIGVVKLQSKLLVSDDPEKSFNIAAPTYAVIINIRDALRGDPETLEKFNQSVVQ